MSRKVFIILLTIFILGIGFYLYARYFAQYPYEKIIYTSISVTKKNNNLLLGDIKIENKKILSDIKDFKIKNFIDNSKDAWQKGELSYPIGGQTITGALLDGTKTTTIEDDHHLLSIYVILSHEFDNDYIFELNLS